MNKGIEVFIEEFKKYLLFEDCSHGTIDTYTTCLKNFFGWVKGEYTYTVELNAISPYDIREYRDFLLDKKNQKVTTVNTKLAAIKKFFIFMTEEKYLDKNPAIDIKKIKINTPPHGAIIYDLDFKRLRREIMFTNNNIQHRLIFAILFFAGLRVSELINLKVTDIIIKESRKESFLMVTRGKGIKYREIPLNKIIIDAYLEWSIERRKRDITSEFLIVTERSKKACRSSINKILNRYGDRIGKPDISPHSARRYFLTKILEVSDISTAQMLAGHSSIQTTSLYTKSSFTKMSEALNKLD